MTSATTLSCQSNLESENHDFYLIDLEDEHNDPKAVEVERLEKDHC